MIKKTSVKMYEINVKAVLTQATQQLQTHLVSSNSASFEAQLLLQHVLAVNRAWIIAHAGDTLTLEQAATFEKLLQRRINGEPMAYILGEREFYGLTLKVSPDTLIPRPDTETLVEAALNTLPHDQKLAVLDLGTGTGAIALAIAKHRPHAQVMAVDFSENALAIAQQNAQNLSIANVTFLHSHWYEAISAQRFDVIVSNPPYIEEHDLHLSLGDVRFEPKSALTSGIDGLDDIRHIVTQSPNYLKLQGWLMLEHGYNQAEAVAALLVQAGFKNISHALDLAGIKRVTLGQYY